MNLPENLTIKKATCFGLLAALLLAVMPIHGWSRTALNSPLDAARNAPDHQITGYIVNEAGDPLPGITVELEHAAATKTVSDENGHFSLRMTGEKDVLILRSVGYERQRIEVTGYSEKLKIVMVSKINELDDLVVVGYGVTKKKDLTGSVSVIEGKDIAKKSVTQLSTALQGMAPGLMVTKSGSIPGNNSASIKIRGITTIGNSDPLILVDGIPMVDIDMINPNDVESISVLKDAASASIYGSRAAAGVILITTKHAKINQLSLNYSGSFGIVQPTELPKAVDYKRYMEMINEVSWNDGGNKDGGEHPVYAEDYIDGYGQNHLDDPDAYPITDWQDVLLNNHAFMNRHNLSLNYGNKFIKMKAAFNYDNEDALYNNRSSRRLSARINTSIKINKFITADLNTAYEYDIHNSPNTNPLSASYKYGPLWTPYWSDGRIGEGRLGTNSWAALNYGGFDNGWKTRFYGRYAINVMPFKGMKISGVLAPTVRTTKTKKFVKKIPYYAADDPAQLMGYINGYQTTSLAESRPDAKELTKQLLVNYHTKLGADHDLELLAGYEDYYTFSESLSASSENLALTEFPYLDRGNLDFLQNNGNASESAYQSYFGRVKYAFADKYLLQANIRFDGSSKFDQNYRWGTFPSIAFGWVATEESFIKNLNLNALSFLKIRASVGTLGNERIGDNYPYQSKIGFGNALFFNGNNIISALTAAQTTYNINNITWESTTSWDIGIDANFLQNRLSLTADYYKKVTNDMLLQLAIPEFMGYNLPYQNAGTMNTKGWDLNVGWKDKAGDFGYSISLNLSDYKSVMGDLSGIVFLGDKIIQEGSEFNEWYGYVSDGLYQSQQDVDNSPPLSSVAKPGDVKYKDISGPDGVPDGIISPTYDKVLLGGSLPRYLYGGNINLSYKHFDLGIMIQGVGMQLSRLSVDQTYQTTQWYNFPQFIDGHYFSQYNTAEENKNARFPRLSQIGFDGNNYVMSDYWLINGAYFRLQNLSLGYTFPRKMIERASMSNLRVYASVSNLLSFDHYPEGWDPETSLSAYIARTWTFGLSVTF